MKIVNGIAHVDEKSMSADLRVIDVEILEEFCLKIEFSNGENKVFDVNQLFEYPIFEKLKDNDIFNTVSIKNGVLVWNDGSIDVGVDFLYKNSIEAN